MPLWLKDKLHMRRTIRQALGAPSQARLIFTDHHESHAASAFFPSPFEQAAIVTLDGVGEWSTATFGVGEGSRIRLIDHIAFPHSLGLLYSAFTYYCGFKVNSGEYKLMGLSPYGKTIYKELILERLINLKADGSFWLNMDYFQYCRGLTMTGGKHSVNPPASVQRVPCPRPRPRLAVGSVLGIPRRNLTMRRGYDVSGAGTSSSHPHARLCSGLRFHGRNRSTSSTARPPAWAHASR